MAQIASISGRAINDSRGQKTVEVTVTDDAGGVATASLPSGSSVGKYEAVMVDADAALQTINTVIAPAMIRMPLDSQRSIDEKLQSFDPTPNREHIGVNSLLGVSLSVARLLAQQSKIPLYHYIQYISSSPGFVLPTPMFNLINGGKHASNNLDFQEYMVLPIGMKTFHDKLAAGRKIFYALGSILHEADSETSIGFEGGYAPNLNTNEEGLGFLVQAIKAAGFVPGTDVVIGVDIAASSLPTTYSATIDNYVSLFENFPMYSVEDPFGEDDWDNWVELKQRLDKLSNGTNTRLLVGDDLFVGSKERLEKGMQLGAANAVLVKINQAATLTELLDCINLARSINCLPVLSHRSGETLDSFVSDLAVGTASQFIKAGSPNDQAPERIVKYERIVEIEEELNVAAAQ